MHVTLMITVTLHIIRHIATHMVNGDVGEVSVMDFICNETIQNINCAPIFDNWIP